MSSNIDIKTLAEKALVAKVSISCFNGIVQDKQITKDTNDANGVKGKRGSYTKRILQGDHFNAMQNNQQKIRNFITSISLPWLDGGWRLIKSVDFIETKRKLDELIAEFNKSVDEFIANYQVIKQKDMVELGSAYNPNDYPNVETMRNKFGVKFVAEKIAETDFRNSGWDAAIIQEMQDNALAEFESRLNAGKVEIVTRLRDELAHLAERLAKGSFKQNSLTNIQEAIASIRNLNITDDSALETLVSNIGAIIPTDAEEVRDSQTKIDETKENVKVSIEAVDELINDLLS